MSKVYKIAISKISGKGLFTMQTIQEGEVVFDLVKEGKPSLKRDKYTIEYDGKHYVHPRAQFINHSSKPNLAPNDGTLFALKKIRKGTELTFDYTATESEFSGEFRP